MEIAQQVIGMNGIFQKTIMGCVISISCLTSFLSVGFPYLTKRPEFLCRNIIEDINEQFHPCEFMDEFCNNHNIELVKDPSRSLDNIAYSFDLYCNQAYYVPLFGLAFFLGSILGIITLAPIPDLYGSPLHYIIINFFAGYLSFIFGISCLIITEYLSRNISGMIMSFTNSAFPATGILMAFYFLYVNNWRYLFLISIVLHLIILVLINKYFVESPRWLLSQRRLNEFMNTLKQIAQYNGTESKWNTFAVKNAHLLIAELPKGKNADETRSYNIIQIFQLNSQRRKMLVLTFVWWSAGFCFYGIVLNLEHLNGNFFSDCIFTFVGEMFSEWSSGYLSNIFGRLIMMKFGGFIGGIGFLLYEGVKGPLWLKSFCIFLTSFGLSATFNIIYIYSSEAIPTPIRSTIISYLLLISRLGAFFVPIVTAVIPSNFAYLVALLSILSGVSCYSLEETLGKDILDDIPEERSEMIRPIIKINRPTGYNEGLLDCLQF